MAFAPVRCEGVCERACEARVRRLCGDQSIGCPEWWNSAVAMRSGAYSLFRMTLAHGVLVLVKGAIDRTIDRIRIGNGVWLRK